MSKISVKKAISQFTPEQLRGLILDIYSKYKDAKEYLDFFAEPDIEKTVDRYRDAINKEVFRIHRHLPAPRLSVIRGILKEFAKLEPGFEAEGELRLETVARLIGLAYDNRSAFNENVFIAIGKFTADTCVFLERNGMLDDHIDLIKGWVEFTRSDSSWLNQCYNILTYSIEPWK